MECGFGALYVVGKTSATTYGSLPASLMMDPPLRFIGAIVDVRSPCIVGRVRTMGNLNTNHLDLKRYLLIPRILILESRV